MIKNRCPEIKIDRGVPPRYKGAHISQFPKDYQKMLNQKSGLYLFGSRGVGKTHLMAALMEHEILNTPPVVLFSGKAKKYREPARGDYPLMISVPEFLNSIRNEINTGGSETILDEHSNVGVLFLDDMGTEKPTEWAEQTLYLLIDRRYNNLRKTVISSNLTLDYLAKRLNDRISSRIAGMCEVLKMEGKDRRLNRNKDLKK